MHTSTSCATIGSERRSVGGRKDDRGKTANEGVSCHHSAKSSASTPSTSSQSWSGERGCCSLTGSQQCYGYCEDPASWEVSYIPVFGSFAQQHQQQQEEEGEQAPLIKDGGGCQAQCTGKGSVANTLSKQDGHAAVDIFNMQLDVVPVSGTLQQHSLQLALEQSGSDWQPQPLDTLVAVMGVPPGWLCAPDSSSLECWGSSCAAVSHPGPAASHAPKLCITVSTVSSELDSLAILPLKLPPGVPLPESHTTLLESRHLGEFCCK